MNRFKAIVIASILAAASMTAFSQNANAAEVQYEHNGYHRIAFNEREARERRFHELREREARERRIHELREREARERRIHELHERRAYNR